MPQTLNYGISAVDFTREPIIETVITPKDGCTLVVRSSKNSGQEEYFVDAIEVVSFGNSFFFRSRERPKSFLVPVSDYELLEVRETRLVLKNVGFDRSIKIAGGREGSRPARESVQEKAVAAPTTESKESQQQTEPPSQLSESGDKSEARLDKKRERRRNYKRKREEQQQAKEPESHLATTSDEESGKVKLPRPIEFSGEVEGSEALPGVVTSVLSSLLPPPVNLISETIARYKDNALFKGVFFVKDEDKGTSESGPKEESAHLEAPQVDDEEISLPTISLDQPKYGTFEVSEEEEEAIYQQRRSMREAAQQKTMPDNMPQEDEQQEVEQAEAEQAFEQCDADQAAEQTAPEETEELEGPEASPLSFAAEEESSLPSSNSEPFEKHVHNHTASDENP